MQAIYILANNTLALIISTTLIGLLIGSFINVIIYRLPKMMQREWREQAREILELPAETHAATFNLVLPNSSCPHCSHEIKPWENIPLISYLFLRGKCSSCKAPISMRYPLVELACGLLSAFIAWHFGFTWQAGAMLLLTWGLLAMSLIDVDHQLLPDSLVLPLLWLGLIANNFGLFTSLEDALLGAIAGYLSLWSVYWLFKLVTGKEGMGYGDFKLLAMLGAWGGWQVLPLTILLSSLVGAVLGLIMLRLRNAETSTPIPFGPYLAIAGWIALLWGEQITSGYLQIAGF
ncbi:A24 family peptidase [Pseudomonas sp. 1928-m]|uniref:prepilin peptidase n=1 Tax=Pseudomonas sp. 1928-m TaxID=3033804 RepID=UPI0023DF20C8|nr:A24 family peptidase [Pseudomonas sp. 1928-m]MDF3193934.1 A24 family peptidase [Pseudomonas sp. 1928-m]